MEINFYDALKFFVLSINGAMDATKIQSISQSFIYFVFLVGIILRIFFLCGGGKLM